MIDKWRTLVALAIIYLAVVMNWQWVWGLLFLMWTVPALYSGRTTLVETVDRDDSPILFWVIIATWLVLSLYLIVADLLLFMGISVV